MASQYGDQYEEWKAQGRPGGDYQAWLASQGGGQISIPTPPQIPSGAYGGSVSAPVPTPTAQGGIPTPAELRQTALQQKWSEDFQRFSDPQLQAWLSSGLYDPSTGKFRSENDPNGPATYDKPAECPPGTTFHGNSCVPYAQLPSWAQESWMGVGGATQPQGAMQPGVAASPLSKVLAPLQGRGGAPGDILPGFPQSPVSKPDITGPLRPGIVPTFQPTSPVQGPTFRDQTGTGANPFGPLQKTLSPLQGQGMLGWSSTSGLQNLLQPLQAKKKPAMGSWF